MNIIQFSTIMVYFLLQSYQTVAQQEMHEFIGTIQLQDKSIISYKVKFEENADGTLQGKSITDFSGEHRTESSIRGRVDRDQNTISFSEEENLTTKSTAKTQDFCYVHLYNAKVKFRKNKSIIQGHFFSRYPDGELCIEGDIYLIGQEQFFRKFDRLTSKTKPFISEEKYQSSVDRFETTKVAVANTVLEKNERLVLFVDKESIKLKIVDDEVLDGDRVQVLVNGKVIEEDVQINGSGLERQIELSSDSTYVRIVALNEGKLPPNTARVSLDELDLMDRIQYKLLEGEHVELVIVRR